MNTIRTRFLLHWTLLILAYWTLTSTESLNAIQRDNAPQGASALSINQDDDALEIRVPTSVLSSSPGASEIFDQVAFQIAAEYDPNPLKPFEVEETETGIRVTWNQPESPVRYQLVGSSIQYGQPEGTAWFVDHRLVIFTHESLAEKEVQEDSAAALKRYVKDSEEDFKERNWMIQSGSEMKLALPDGHDGFLWVIAPEDERAAANLPGILEFVIAATIHGGSIIAVTRPVREGEDSDAALASVKQTILTMERLPKREPRKKPTVEELKQRGLTLGEGLFIRDRLRSNKHAALLNRSLATRRDLQLDNALALSTEKTIEFTALSLAITQTGPDWDESLRDLPDYKNDVRWQAQESAYNALLVEAIVFDGVAAHAVILNRYEPKSRRFVYWEPWKEGSFLQRANNQADVEAQQHPSNNKNFSVSEEELGKVFHSVILKWEQVVPLIALVELLQESYEETIETITVWQTEQPNHPLLDPRILLLAGHHYLVRENHQTAINAFLATAKIAPSSAQAASGLADVLRELGDKEQAAGLYEAALKKIPDDDLLTDDQRKKLIEHIHQHRR